MSPHSHVQNSFKYPAVYFTEEILHNYSALRQLLGGLGLSNSDVGLNVQNSFKYPAVYFTEEILRNCSALRQLLGGLGLSNSDVGLITTSV